MKLRRTTRQQPPWRDDSPSWTCGWRGLKHQHSAVVAGLMFAACLPHRETHEDQATSQPARSDESKTTSDYKPLAPAPSPASSDARGKQLHGPRLTAPFEDNFERATLGPNWAATSSAWRIQGGQLCATHARNHPVWLDRRVPTNAVIEFDAVSHSRDGDIKVELWGDGRSYATGTSYDDATSYIAILGGWKNTRHVLARLDEHARDRQELVVDRAGDQLSARAVEPGRLYHFKLARRDGKTVQWWVDDIDILSYNDQAPLVGSGHEHIAFNDWDARVCFDNLRVTPL